MHNSQCICDVLLFVDANHNTRADGRFALMKGRKILYSSELAEKHSSEDIRYALEYLSKYDLLICTALNAHTSRISIRGITPKGYEYLEKLKQPAVFASKAFMRSLFTECTPAPFSGVAKELLKKP